MRRLSGFHGMRASISVDVDIGVQLTSSTMWPFDHIPPVARRLYYPAVITGVLLIVAVAGLLLMLIEPLRSLSGRFAPQRVSIVVAFVLVLLFWAAVYYAHVGQKRLRRRIDEYNREVCCRCGQSLTGHDDVGQCPECGGDFDKGQLTGFWEVWMTAPRFSGISWTTVIIMLVVQVIALRSQPFWTMIGCAVVAISIALSVLAAPGFFIRRRQWLQRGIEQCW